ncbi:MAG: ABC transporter permease [Bacilli bacterium]|nr:ABC transporter permease [Bacilli bacterium]
MNSSFKKDLRIFSSLTHRHLKMIMANKIRLFYTLMVPVILLLVYVILLRTLEVSMVSKGLVEMGIDLSSNPELDKGVATVVDAWMLSGFLSLSILAIALQSNSLLVEDKEKGINRDFVASPVKKNVLIASYFVYNFIVTLILSLVVALLAIIIIACYGEFYFSFLDILSILGTVILNTFEATLITTFICLFISNEPILASVIGIVSAAAGFLMGAYMPFAMLPTGVQYFCCLIPGTYGTSIIRYSFLATPFSNISNFFANNLSVIPAGESVESIMKQINSFGYNVNFFGIDLDLLYCFIITLAFIAVFIVLNLIFAKRIVSFEKVKKHRTNQK